MPSLRLGAVTLTVALAAGCSTVGHQAHVPPPPPPATWNPNPPPFVEGDPIRFVIGGFILTWEKP